MKPITQQINVIKVDNGFVVQGTERIFTASDREEINEKIALVLDDVMREFEKKGEDNGEKIIVPANAGRVGVAAGTDRINPK
jgi:hypothetical protein